MESTILKLKMFLGQCTINSKCQVINGEVNLKISPENGMYVLKIETEKGELLSKFIRQ